MTGTTRWAGAGWGDCLLVVLRNRSFLAIWLAQLISSLGDYFYWLAMPLTILKLTGSTVAMGTAMISLALPALLLGPVAGVMVDRWDRHRTMLGSSLGRGLVVLLCLAVQSPEQVWIFYLVGALDATCGVFFFPARNAAVPLVVEEQELTAANGLLQVTMTFSMIAGAGLAGVAIQFLGLSFAFAADAAAYAVATVCVSLAAVPRTTAGRAAMATHPVRAVAAEMHEGLRYITASRTLVGVLACNVVLQLGLGALNVVWVPFMQRTFGVGPAGLGAVDAAQGVGMAVGGVAVGYLALRFRKVTLVGGGLAWAGLMLVLVGTSPGFGWVILWAGLAGLAIPPIMASLTTITQVVVPDLKRGRVGALMGSLATVASILSMVAAGLAGERVDLRWIYSATGLLIALAGAVSLVAVEEPAGMVQEGAPLPAAEEG